VEDPLGLPWRRLRVLVQQLPYESRTMGLVRSIRETAEDDADGLPSWYRELHPDVKPRTVMSDLEWLSRQQGR